MAARAWQPLSGFDPRYARDACDPACADEKEAELNDEEPVFTGPHRVLDPHEQAEDARRLRNMSAHVDALAVYLHEVEGAVTRTQRDLLVDAAKALLRFAEHVQP